MGPDGEHAYAAGYLGPRGTRTWQERMSLLEELGFIKTVPGGNMRYRWVLLVHPAMVIKRLHDAGKVPEQWFQLYRSVQIEGHETRHEAFEAPAEPETPAEPKAAPEPGKAAESDARRTDGGPAKVLRLQSKKPKESKKRA